MMPQTARRLTRLLALALIWVVTLCTSALAHASLSEADPAAGQTVSQSPEQVRLQFTEPVEAAFDPVKVFDSAGERVDEQDARVAPEDVRVVVTDLKELAEGTYTVEWRVTSVDGHVVSDAYEFTVAAAAVESGAESRDGAGAAQQGGEQAGEQPVDEQDSAAQEEEGAEGESSPIATYTAATFGIGLLAVLVVLGVNLLHRKPRS